MGENICDTVFFDYKISSPIVKGIMVSGPNNTKYLVSS